MGLMVVEWSRSYMVLMLVLVVCGIGYTYGDGVEYKVGELHSWGIPSSANPDVYTNWSKSHTFTFGDSLLFLYPPSQDSVIQVSPQAYDSCDLKHPILSFKRDGNSVFNITQPPPPPAQEEGEFYFTSGETGHCQKGQKLHIKVTTAGSHSPSSADSMPDAAAPSYANAFGSIPTSSASSFIPSFIPFIFVFTFTACILLA